MNLPIHRSRGPAAFALVLAAVLAAALTGCAPGIASGGDRVPYREGTTYDAPAGGTLYVTLDRPLDETGLTTDLVRRQNLNWVPLGIRGESANATGFVTLPPPEAPEDWEVRLWQTRVIRERPLGDPEGPLSYRLEIELRVDVPASAEGLTRRIRGGVRIEGGETIPIDFLVRAD